jgi:hypothetical protein
MIFTICRDQRTGETYTDEAAEKDIAEYGYYANEAADIEVEINEGPAYKGSGSPDDPDSVDVSGVARVCDDVRYYPPLAGGKPQFERFVFRAGQVIDLTDDELRDAEDQALEEAREAAIPEYYPE